MSNNKKSKRRLVYNIFSVAFLLSIPLILVSCIILIDLLFYLFKNSLINEAALVSFLYGLIASTTILFSSSMPWIKTLIHEIKHAVAIILSGNKLDSMQVGSGTGLVTFRMYKTRKRYAPFILLAPYFFPLFSLPVFLGGLLLQIETADAAFLIYSVLLGLATGADLSTAYLETHPHQSDLRRILGGRVTAYTFIFIANITWLLFITYWITSS